MIEALLIAAAAGFGIWAYEKHKEAGGVPGGDTSGAGPVGQDSGPSGPGPGGGTVDSTGQGPTTTPAPPAPKPQPSLVPILVAVVGGDGDSYVTATPGGDVGPLPGSSKTFWYSPGQVVMFRAHVEGFAPFTAFDHFEGPGIATFANPLVVPIQSAGFVRGVFRFLGR